MYAQWTTANYGKTSKPREKKKEEFKVKVVPFDPPPPVLLRAYVVKE